MPQQNVQCDVFLFQDIQPQRQRGEGGVDLGAHKVGKGKVAVGAAQQQRYAGVKMGDTLAGNIVDRGNAAAVGRALQGQAKQRFVQSRFVRRCPAQGGAFGQQIDPGVQIAGAVVAVHHRHGGAVRRGDHIDLGVNAGQRLFQHDHGKNARPSADISRARGNAVGGCHAGAGIPLRRAKRYAGLQNAGGVQQLCAAFGQRACVRARTQYGRQQRAQVEGVPLFCRQFVEFFKHGGVILPGCAVDGEHPAGVAHAQRIDAGQQKVQVACQGRDVGDLFKVRLPIQHSLIQVRHAPPLGNVKPEGGGQLCRCGGGHGVAPGAERNQ